MTTNFTNVIKPTHLCNLACSYCYNEDVRRPIMAPDVLRRVISETFAYCRSKARPSLVDFIWHGGEPMLAGRDFYRDAIRIEKEQSGPVQYHNTLQTNGVMIDEAWASFLVGEGFRVSLSIDGPREIHDRTRHYISGRGSFDAVMRAIEVLRAHKIPFGVAVVISRANRDRVEEIYEFLVENRLPFNVIPLTRSGDALANFDDLGLAPDEYAAPWIKMFDRWYEAGDTEYVYCSDFAFKTRAILVGKPQDCIGQAICSEAHISTDPLGNIYPCATLSADPEWLYGNIMTQPLTEILAGEVATRAVNRPMDPHCARCKWQHVCHGGCMQRAIKFYGTHGTRDYYCDSLYTIYEHIERRLREETKISLDALPPADYRDDRQPPSPRPIKSRTPGHVVRTFSKFHVGLTAGKGEERHEEVTRADSQGEHEAAASCTTGRREPGTGIGRDPVRKER